MGKILTLISTFLLIFIVLVGCSQEKEKNIQTENEKIKIYTTIFPIEDFSKKIGGKFVDVQNVVPIGSDAHSFEPTTKTMTRIAEGDLFIFLGTGIDGFADTVMNAVRNENTKTVKASEGIHLIKSSDHGENEDHGEEEEVHEGEEEGDFDPHIWLDPIRSIRLAENIKNALVEVKPDQKQYFEENYKTLKENLEKLNLSFKTMVEDSPNNTFIVAHSAYGYWEDAYGLKQIGISGLSPSDEPSQKKLEEIIKNAEQEKFNYILFEQNVESRVAKVIKQEIGAETLTLHNLESLNEEDIKNNEDYLSIMKKNIETIKQVLK